MPYIIRRGETGHEVVNNDTGEVVQSGLDIDKAGELQRQLEREEQPAAGDEPPEAEGEEDDEEPDEDAEEAPAPKAKKAAPRKHAGRKRKGR